jgi:hypothetical protein
VSYVGLHGRAQSPNPEPEPDPPAVDVIDRLVEAFIDVERSGRYQKAFLAQLRMLVLMHAAARGQDVYLRVIEQLRDSEEEK